MNNIIKLARSQLVKNILTMASGIGLSQLITITFSPIITRLYGPEAFGIQGTFNAVISLATPIIALAYPIAIILPEKDDSAIKIAQLSLIISLLISSICYILLSTEKDLISDVIGIKNIENYVYLVPTSMLLICWTQISQQWLIRKKQYSIIAKTYITNTTIINLTKSIIGIINPTGITLIVINTLGYALHSSLMLIGIKKNTKLNVNKKNKIKFIAIAKKYVDFPLYRAPQNLINASSQSLPILLLTTFFSPTIAGYYTLARLVMGIPSALLGKAVNDVFYPRINEGLKRGENIAELVVKATLVMAAIGIIPLGLITIFGPYLFSAIFGSNWLISGEYARWLGIFFFFNFINKPSVAAVPVLKIQKGLLIYELFSTGLKIIAFTTGAFIFNNDIWAIGLFSISGAMAYATMIIWIILVAKKAHI